MRSGLLIVALASGLGPSLGFGLGCTAMSQNIKGQELSYRGTWYCEKQGCAESDMVASRRGGKNGEVRFHSAKLNPRAAMVFTAAAPFSRLEATVTDCAGTAVALPEEAFRAPGSHDVGDSAVHESWLILVDGPVMREHLKFGGDSGCDTIEVAATAHWDDGRSFTLRAGIKSQ